MPNIAFFIYNITLVGGTERVASVIVNELAKRNYNIHLLSLNGNPSDVFFPLEPNVNVTSLHMDKVNGVQKVLRSRRRIRKLVKNYSIDTFITVESNMAIHSVPSLAFTGVRHVVWEHFNFKVSLGLASRSLARQLSLCFADRIVTLTARDTHFLAKEPPKTSSRARSAPKSVDVIELETKIRSLEQELEEAQFKAIYYSTLVRVAEQELGMDIEKKRPAPGPLPSNPVHPYELF